MNLLGIKKSSWFLILIAWMTCVIWSGCHGVADKIEAPQELAATYVMVLGVAQDAGYPQANCEKSCCRPAWDDPSLRRMVSCIGVVDTVARKYWIFDATPDFKDQLQMMKTRLGAGYELGGVFITHAHIGHYTGLIQLGKEVIGAELVPTYVMPRMASFLSSNGPWSQLIKIENVDLKRMSADSAIVISETLTVTPVLVPHRDEYSETVGFSISSGDKKLMFIPDIDKWERWDRDIKQVVEDHDYALLDATFYADGELGGRDMSMIPHPFVSETMETFANADKKTKEKIHFIHINHTNPILDPSSSQYQDVISYGAGVCEEGQTFSL